MNSPPSLTQGNDTSNLSPEMIDVDLDLDLVITSYEAARENRVEGSSRLRSGRLDY